MAIRMVQFGEIGSVEKGYIEQGLKLREGRKFDNGVIKGIIVIPSTRKCPWGSHTQLAMLHHNILARITEI